MTGGCYQLAVAAISPRWLLSLVESCYWHLEAATMRDQRQAVFLKIYYAESPGKSKHYTPMLGCFSKLVGDPTNVFFFRPARPRQLHSAVVALVFPHEAGCKLLS